MFLETTNFLYAWLQLSNIEQCELVKISFVNDDDDDDHTFL